MTVNLKVSTLLVWAVCQVPNETYEAAGIDPSAIGPVEAHGTGTKAGDACEVDSLKAFFDNPI